MPVVENNSKGNALTPLQILEDIMSPSDETHEESDTESSEEFTNVETPSQVEVKPKQDEKKSKKEDGKEYFQSKADKAEALLRKLGIEGIDADITEIKRNAEIGKLLKENPQELLKALNIEIPKQTVEEKRDVLVKPVKPNKPSNYNHQDAMLDENSDSFRYNLAMQEYNEKLADYNEAIIEKTESERIKKMQEQQLTESQRQARLKVITELVTEDGFTKAEAEDFLETMNSIKDRKDFVKVYRLMKGVQENKDTKKTTPKAMIPPITESSDDDSDEQEMDFMDMQKAYADKVRIKRS